MSNRVWIVEFNDRDESETNVAVHANETLAYDDAISSIKDDVSNNWDSESSDYENIMERIDSITSNRDKSRIITLYNSTQSNNDRYVSYQVYDTAVNGDMNLSVSSSGPAAFIPNTPEGSGCTCKKCGNFSQYAGPNYTDGSFVCSGCRLWERHA